MATHPIIQKVNEYFGVNVLENPSTKKREIVFARMTCLHLMWLATNLTGFEIVKYFGTKDHTRIRHARQAIFDLCKTDPSIRQQIIELESLFE